MKSLYIGIDFDGTVVEKKYPEIGEPLEGAVEVISELVKAGHKIILYTMRSGDRLDEAVEYLNDNGIFPYAINENPSQKYWTKSPKIFCNIYIDDCSLGVPLDDKGYVDWDEVRDLLVVREVL